jgi:hypothetical protein
VSSASCYSLGYISFAYSYATSVYLVSSSYSVSWFRPLASFTYPIAMSPFLISLPLFLAPTISIQSTSFMEPLATIFPTFIWCHFPLLPPEENLSPHGCKKFSMSVLAYLISILFGVFFFQFSYTSVPFQVILSPGKHFSIFFSWQYSSFNYRLKDLRSCGYGSMVECLLASPRP